MSIPQKIAYKEQELASNALESNNLQVVGNAVKYIARAGLKDPDHEITDLRKAIWYLNREIVRIAKTKDTNTSASA